MPGGTFVGALTDAIVAGDDNPSAFPAKSANPVRVFCVGAKFVLQMRKAVFGFDHLMQGARVPNGQAIIEEKPHAASLSSNSTASSTSSDGTPYQRQTSATDPLARTARASISVGTALGRTIGRPKLRVGSRTTSRRLVEGRQRTSTSPSPNSSS